MLGILVFILVLSILVLVHELGHFFVAKRAGILVEEFGFGIPPRIFGKKIGETIYSINLFPFGGFVRLHGENSEDEVKNVKRAFITQSKKVRTAIICAGVSMNFILAIFAFAAVYTFSGIPKDTGEVKIIEVQDAGPAKSSGFKAGDVIVEVGNVKVYTSDEFVSEVNKYLDSEASFLVKREDDNQNIALSAIPRKNPPKGEGALGVIVSNVDVYYPPVWQRPFLGIYFGFKEALFWTGIIISGLFSMIKGLAGGIVPKDVAGPVGIYALTSQAASLGIFYLINFVGVLSVNLAILNILPIPALDGGRLLFVFIESVVGKKVVPKVENIVHTVGMALLLLLLLAITFNDIKRLIEAGSIAKFLESVMQ